MIIDKIENLKNYVGVNRHFSKVIEFLEANDLNALENGKHEIDGPDCFVNIMDTKGKTKEEAVMETHRRMLDIQIPLDADETYGYTPTADLPEAEYNEAKDVTKYPGVQGESFITCHPGMMAVFLPEDGHQPCIGTAENIHKAVIKIAVG
ncbi:MAG: YhcH/YjgK/YiaL family protein [Prevotella sp.]|nr:YhcH/YjgK/YiaL family protein [Bacteroidales bacterium]MDY4926855.1 YhcH/YjgK/YiaL family protein [Prevotella sp.]MDY5034098.1 YhcH/YjgK/YiaL family protein [Prevotella sp.]